ncbi:hypothetical protein JCM11641_003258 [Rhodosporidiobolus odoratus]
MRNLGGLDGGGLLEGLGWEGGGGGAGARGGREGGVDSWEEGGGGGFGGAQVGEGESSSGQGKGKGEGKDQDAKPKKPLRPAATKLVHDLVDAYLARTTSYSAPTSSPPLTTRPLLASAIVRVHLDPLGRGRLEELGLVYEVEEEVAREVVDKLKKGEKGKEAHGEGEGAEDFKMRLVILAILTGIALRAVLGQKANTFEVVGTVGVSPQQAFAVDNMVYIVDKVEANPTQVNNHPAWAGSYNLDTNQFTPIDVVSNSFCAGGTVLGNGSWVNIGGNAAVGPLGVGLAAGAANPYGSVGGGKAVRMLSLSGDGDGDWTDDIGAMPSSRWYPTIETLPTGDAIIIGGELYGSFVNTPEGLQNVPTYEYWPTRGVPVNMTFLEETMPVNLYPLTWLLSDGRLFLQAGWQTTLLDYENNIETRLPNVTHAQRPYPAGAGSTMLTLTEANNWTETIVFAGGVVPERDDWNQNLWHPVDTAASSSLVSITPLSDNPQWADLDDLPEGRTMGNLVMLPDKRVLMLNGASFGSEGYGWDSWAAPYGQSYAHTPILRPAYLDTSAAQGQMWDMAGLPNSTVPRLYHSVATLVKDGSVWIGGSNPNVDVITEQNNATYPYKVRWPDFPFRSTGLIVLTGISWQTEYRVERFYPSYYDSPRPLPSNLPTRLSYGGSPFDVALPAESVRVADLEAEVSVMLMRTGFSTHVMNMGARSLELPHTFSTNDDGSVTLHVSQLPPNAALFQPGPAMLFVVVKGVPSNGSTVMVGNGQLGTQPTQALASLPTASGSTNGGSGGSSRASSEGSRLRSGDSGLLIAFLLGSGVVLGLRGRRV